MYIKRPILIAQIAFVVMLLTLIVVLMTNQVRGQSLNTTNISRVGMTTEFSYQGNLAEDNNPANGTYDFRVRLYDAATSGTQIGTHNEVKGTTVVNGIFSIYLDFGDVFNGRMRWIEVDVKQTDSAEDYITLAPRQELHPVPYALYAESTLETWQFNQLDLNSDTGELQSAFSYIFMTDPGFPQGSERTVLVNAPIVAKQIEALHVIVPTRTGEYTSTYTLSFEIRSFDGEIQHTVSAVPLDLKTIAEKQFVEIDLSANTEDVIVEPGEYLAITVRRGGAQGGSIVVTLAAYALVRNALVTPSKVGQ